MKTRVLYGMLLTAVISFAACKKDDAKKQQQCRISSINLNGTEATNFNYDEQGRVSVMTKGDVVTTYSYTAGGYVRQMLNANKLTEKATAEFNAQGRIFKITTQRFDGSGNINFSGTHTYEYNGNGEIVKSVTKNGNIPEQTTTYTWSNGNLIQASQGVIYTYYTDKPVQDGDILRTNQLQA